MNNKHHFLLDLLSRLDEGIVDKVTAARCRSMGRRSARGRLIAIVAVAAALAVLLGAFAVMMLLPDTPDVGGSSGETTGGTVGDTVPEKQVPIYQGMTVSNTKPTFNNTDTASVPAIPVAGLMARSSVPLLPLGNSEGNSGNGNSNGNSNSNGDNGNHNGHHKKPVEDVVADSLVVEGGLENVYYAKPGEDIYITIHFHNPDDFEIMSFTLNGSKYSSYMFEDGSDMENLVLKYNVGNAQGILDLTIDAIKYIDGTEIKDVLIDGNKTVRVCVYPENQPKATVKNEVVGLNDVEFTVTVTDPMGLIALSGGQIQAIVSDGEQIVSSKDIPVGEETTVTLDGLDAGVTYEYAVVVSLDRMDGEGFGSYVIAKNTFTTETCVAFTGVAVTQDGVSFGYLWNDTAADQTIHSLALYRDGEKVRELDKNATAVGELLSDNTYTLRATYTDNGETKTIALTFTTNAKATPAVTLSKGDVTQSSLTYVYGATDPDGVITDVTVELLHGDDAPITGDISNQAFTGLLSDHRYTVRLTYKYDLCDGVGEREDILTLEIKTLAKTVPEITFSKGNVTQSSLTYVYGATDPDGVITDVTVELLHGDDAPITGDISNQAFTGLLSDNRYTVRLTYKYDLCDGKGERTETQELSYKTRSRRIPSVTFSDMESTRYTVTGRYLVADLDGVILSETAKVYDGNTAISTVTGRVINATGLTYYTEYTVTVTLTYDLGDGKGVQTLNVTKTVMTQPFADVASVAVRNTSAVSEGDTIYLQADLNNPTGATVLSVVVNGETYSVTNSSTSSRVVVEILNNGQFAGGNTTLTVEKLRLGIDGAEYTVDVDTQCSADIFINGKLEVLSIAYTDALYQSTDVLSPGEGGYIAITLSNPTDYEIRSLTIDPMYETGFVLSGGELIRVNQNLYVYPAENLAFPGEVNFVHLVSLEYGNEYLTKTAYPTDNTVSSATCVMLVSDEVKYISTPDDLRDVDDWYRYELTCDIDLAGIEWHSVPFNGVLEGNGYAIRNMSYVGQATGELGCVGLFGLSNGCIRNLHIENCFFIVNSDQMVHYGAIAACREMYVSLEGCSVDADSVVSITGSAVIAGGLVGSADVIKHCTNSSTISVTTSRGEASVGGICGAYATYVAHCTNDGNITVATGTTDTGRVHGGGIVGKLDSGAMIFGCTNHGDVTLQDCNEGGVLDYAAGGIVGRSSGTISDCINTGKIFSRFWAGGIANVAGDSSVILNCLNLGTVETSHTRSSGGIVGGREGGEGKSQVKCCVNVGDLVSKKGACLGISSKYMVVENCYALSLYNSTAGTVTTLSRLGDKSFWTDTLGWDESIWCFDELDFESGKHPTLRDEME